MTIRNIFLRLFLVLTLIHFLNISALSQSYRAFALTQEGKWILIDENGKKIGNEVYDGVDPMNNGAALVSRKGRYEYIGKDGKVLVNGGIVSDETQWLTFKDFIDGFARVEYKKGRGWTWIDSTGRIVTNERLAEVGNFSNGLASARKNGQICMVM